MVQLMSSKGELRGKEHVEVRHRALPQATLAPGDVAGRRACLWSLQGQKKAASTAEMALEIESTHTTWLNLCLVGGKRGPRESTKFLANHLILQ